MLDELRRRVVAGDQDIGEALVVAQQHVEARLQLLDEIGFQQQRLGFGLRRDEHHRRASAAIIRAMRLVWPCRRV